MAKLLDFGAAADYGTELNRSVSVVLKEGYAPPEQYSSHGNRGPWSDVYALCATIYSLITGLIPKNSVERMVKDELRYPSEFGVKITPEQEAVLMCGLAVQLGQRFSSMKDLQNGFHSADKGIVPECAKPFFKSKKGTVSPSSQETEILSGDFGGQLDGREAAHLLKNSGKAGENSDSKKRPKSGWFKAGFRITAVLIMVLTVVFLGNIVYEYRSLQLAANQGDAEAQYDLGNISYVLMDFEGAVKYYQLAANQGYAKAQYDLGKMYQYGYGVDKDYNESAKYYQLAADQGYAKAQYNIGKMFKYGRGVDKDYVKAVKYYRLAADQGYAKAQYDLGEMYKYGYGVGKDYEEAVKYYQLAADQGHAEAQNTLGTFYQWGWGVKENYEEAAKYYQLAADQGDTEARYNLGRLYEKGLGVEQDYEKAKKYYQLAADKRHTEAQKRLEALSE